MKTSCWIFSLSYRVTEYILLCMYPQPHVSACFNTQETFKITKPFSEIFNLDSR